MSDFSVTECILSNMEKNQVILNVRHLEKD